MKCPNYEYDINKKIHKVYTTHGSVCMYRDSTIAREHFTKELYKYEHDRETLVEDCMKRGKSIPPEEI